MTSMNSNSYLSVCTSPTTTYVVVFYRNDRSVSSSDGSSKSLSVYFSADGISNIPYVSSISQYPDTFNLPLMRNPQRRCRALESHVTSDNQCDDPSNAFTASYKCINHSPLENSPTHIESDMSPIQVSTESPSAILETLKTASTSSHPAFLLVYGSLAEDGQSWCPVIFLLISLMAAADQARTAEQHNRSSTRSSQKPRAK